MSDFKPFRDLLQKNFDLITIDANTLFEVELDKDELWNLYLDSFPAGTNEIFRQRRHYDCSCCRHFVKSVGNVITIKNNKIQTIWGFDAQNEKFQVVIDALDSFVKSKIINDKFVSKFRYVGKNLDREMVNTSVVDWYHFWLDLGVKFFDNGPLSIGDLKGKYRSAKEVFERSLKELTKDSILTVLELISSNSLYKGLEWEKALKEFLQYHITYNKLPENEKSNYVWAETRNAGPISKIRNHSIGVLLIDISEGMDLDKAVTRYEKIVAPENYKRPKAIYTKSMLEAARKEIEKLGYMDALERKHASLDDITINNILFSNKDLCKESGNIFDTMNKEIPLDIKKFSKVEEISYDKFVKDVLPLANELEVFLENRLSNNMMSLIAPKKVTANMLKWNNNFTWAYTGNITDSSIKDRVKSAGGNVTGVLRFSIQWNDVAIDKNDLDAHCTEPNGHEIYFSDKVNPRTSGFLDVDIITPKNDPAVENITWTNKAKMLEGVYKFRVHNYTHRGGKDGFRAEIEYDGQTYSFDYRKELKQREYVDVAYVNYSKQDGFSISEKLPSTTATKDLWNLKTNQFVPVYVVMNSPNYWDEQKGIGNKHIFFMLKNCVNPENPSGFFNEFLQEDLMKHKRVFEALSSKMRVEDTDNQLSGLGFSITKRDSLLIKIKGNTERLLKIKF